MNRVNVFQTASINIRCKLSHFFSLCLAAMMLVGSPAYAAPQGGEVTAGSGDIQTPDANTTVVNQQSSTMSINWESLNLNNNELLQFRQPGQDSISLNHILDQNPTQIHGQIEANGQVFLMNPNGLIFGESARINTGGLFAGAFQMDSEFINSQIRSGEYTLNIGDGSVENFGNITARDGADVVLLGNSVTNAGSIDAKLGKIHLLSADEAVMSFDQDGMIQFAISKESLANGGDKDSAIENSGILQADGGYVVLDAQAANDVFVNVVNNSGVIHAARISNEGGVIRLEGTGGVVANTGELNATGGEGSTGGSISLYGDRVGVFDGSVINASGEQGGGNIYIGGQRKGTGDHTAEITQVARDTIIKADAIKAGNGGEIIVWADDSTWAYGDFSATGGEQSGDGGFLEISGKQGLAMDANINLKATHGQDGTLLIDPADIIIFNGTSSDDSGDAFLPEILAAEGAGTLNIDEVTLEGIASGMNIILEATNNITINDLADNLLGLQTGTVNTVTITANSDNLGSGNFIMNTGDTISTNGGAITITGDTIVLGTIVTNGATDGNITASSKAGMSIVSADAGTANISLSINTDNSVDADSLAIAGSMTGASIAFDGQGNGSEQLIGKNLDSTWNITSANGGTYFSSGFSTTANFTNFSNLVGGNQDDDFTMSPGGSLTGKIYGGNQAIEDTVNYSTASSGPGTVTLETDVTNIEKITGGPFHSELIATNSANSWSITGADDGTVAGINFFNFKDLTGGTGVDTFTLNGGSISGTITGGAGNDKLIGNTGPNTWNITGADDAGNVTSVFAFSSIENLTGNSGVDSFIFADGINLSLAIDGAGGSDSVDKSVEATNPVNFIIGGTGLNGYTNIESFTGGTAGVITSITGEDINSPWTITGDGSGQVVGTVTSSFTDIDNITGGTADDDFTFSGTGKISGILDGGAGAGDDTLTANNEVNTWTITDANDGTVSGDVTGLYTSFQDIENLTGNANNDAFNFNTSVTATISGNISGAGETTSDVVDLSAKTADIIVDLSKYNSIESFIANGANSNELQNAQSTPTTWNITGTDTGNIGGSISFSNFDTLTGNAAVDLFILGTSGNITGSIAGGLGSDILQSSTSGATWNITGPNAGNIAASVTVFSDIETLQGDSGADTFNFTGGITSFTGLIDGGGGVAIDSVDFSSLGVDISVDLNSVAFVDIESYTGSGGATSTITGKPAANTWNITSADTGTVTSGGIPVIFNNFTNLVGNSLQDTFTLSGTGNISGDIDAAGGTNDTLVGNNLATTWIVTAADTGTVTDANGANVYSGIEILTGGSAKDDYDFQYIGAYPITDGGGDLNDTASFLMAGAVVANLGPTGLSNIEFLIGNNTDSTVTVTAAGDNAWTIDSGTNNGSVILNGGAGGTVNFDNFTALTGGGGSDVFQFQNGASTPATGITGLIDGGAGTNSVTFAAVNAGTVDVVLDTSRYTNIGTFTGSTNVGGASTLTGENTTNNWNITGADQGDIDTNSINFVDFQNLTGGTGADNFVLNGGTVLGIIDGGTGNDTVTGDNAVNAWGIVATAAGVVTNGTVTGVTGNFTNIENLTGNVGDDTFTFSDGTSISGVVDGAGGSNDTANHAAQLGLVGITLGGSGYTNIENFIGNGANSTLTGDNIVNSWQVTGVDSGQIGTTTFSAFGNLQGGTGDDSFSVTDAGSLTGASGLDGGAGGGTDILQGGVSAHTWNITGAESGDIDGVTSFSDIETLTGNAGVDDFVFSGAGSFSGLIDGGASNDTVDISSLAVDKVVSIAAASTTSIEDYIGNSATNNSTLQGRSIADNWIVTGANTGTVNGITFSFFNRLDGDDGADTFAMQPAGRITGYIDGGLGNDSITTDPGNTNTWGITALDTGNLDSSGLITNFQNVENLTGNSSVDTFNIGANLTGSIDGGAGDDIYNLNGLFTVGGNIAGGANNDTLNGPNAAIVWGVTGVNSGVVNGNTFSNIENLVGNAGVDTFNISNSATAGITGSMSGGAGNDIFSVDYNDSSTRTIVFDGGTGTDSLTLTGAGAGFNNSYVFGPLVDDVEVTTSGGTFTQIVDVAGIDSVSDIMTAGTITLTGSAGIDAMTLSDGAVPGTDTLFDIGGLLPVEFSNKTNLSIIGGAGVDSLTIDDAHSFAGDITLAVETLTQGVAGQLGANNLILNGVDTAGTSGNRLLTDINNLQVNGPTTDVYVTEQDALSLDITNVNSVLDIELLTGDIVANNDIITSAASTFRVAGGNSITLNGSNNQFTGSLAFTSPGTLANVTLVNTTPVDLAALTLSNDLSITTTGDITQSGVLTVGGNSSFSAGSNAITLSNAANDFTGSVTLQNAGANNIAITDLNALSFGSSSIGSGALTVTAGSIAQTGPITQQANAGATTFTANTGSLILDNGVNDFTGTVSLINNSASGTSITESDHLTLGSSTTNGGNLSVTAANGVTLTGTTASNNGDIDITASTGDILLGKLNAGSGKITLIANTGNVFGDNSSITDPNLTGQDLVISSGQKLGEITNPIAVSVPANGTGLFNAGVGVPHIIGFEGQFLSGSDQLYDESFLILAANKRQNFTFSPVFMSSDDGFYFLPLYTYADGGVQWPDYTRDEEDEEQGN